MSDLINRSALLRSIAHLSKLDNLANEFVPAALTMFRAVAYYIQGAPAVDAVEVVHSEWVVEKIPGHRRGSVRRFCKKCGCNNLNRKSNYCPNCGAKMDGERKDNELQQES